MEFVITQFGRKDGLQEAFFFFFNNAIVVLI